MDTNHQMIFSASGEHRPLACWRRLPAVVKFPEAFLPQITQIVIDHVFDERKWNRQDSLR